MAGDTEQRQTHANISRAAVLGSAHAVLRVGWESVWGQCPEDGQVEGSG